MQKNGKKDPAEAGNGKFDDPCGNTRAETVTCSFEGSMPKIKRHSRADADFACEFHLRVVELRAVLDD